MLNFLNFSLKFVIIFLITLLLFAFSTLWYFSSDLPDYKILSKLLAMRLSPLLSALLDDTQAGIPGRVISDPIHNIQSVISSTEKRKDRTETP